MSLRLFADLAVFAERYELLFSFGYFLFGRLFGLIHTAFLHKSERFVLIGCGFVEVFADYVAERFFGGFAQCGRVQFNDLFFRSENVGYYLVIVELAMFLRGRAVGCIPFVDRSGGLVARIVIYRVLVCEAVGVVRAFDIVVIGKFVGSLGIVIFTVFVVRRIVLCLTVVSFGKIVVTVIGRCSSYPSSFADSVL